jgi:hypothetical protein
VVAATCRPHLHATTLNPCPCCAVLCCVALRHHTPVQTPECTDIFQKWVLDQATHFKSLDQRHLLTVGSEGEPGGGRAYGKGMQGTAGEGRGELAALCQGVALGLGAAAL